ncbi:MAG: porin [Deltaproteobacteria bacterium]|nr:porin [Deltaproteobacteria bacterium]
MKKTAIIFITILMSVAFAKNIRAAELGSVDIHGFISQGYLYSDSYNYLANDTEGGTFQFNEVGINFSKDLTDELRVGMQFFARDLGDLNNDEVILDWAFADYHWRDWAGLRAGKLKVPFGLYNETRDIDLLRTSVLLPSGVYLESFRDAFVGLKGVGLYGDVSLGIMGGAAYQLQLGTMNVDNDNGIAKMIESLLSFNMSTGMSRQMGTSVDVDVDVTDFKVDEVYNGALQWNTPLEGLRLGSSIFLADFKADADIDLTAIAMGIVDGEFEFRDLVAYTLSAEYTWENLVLACEYFNLEMDVCSDLTKTPKELEGYYVGASYRFTDWFELGTYYSVAYPDATDKDGNKRVLLGEKDYSAWSKDLALSSRFDINEYWVFKMEGHWMDGTAYLLDVDNPDGFPDKNWFMFAAKLSFNF